MSPAKTTRIRLFRLFSETLEELEDPRHSIGEWLIARYGPVPSVNVYVYAGEPVAANDITGDIPRLVASDAPYYTVLEAPGAGVNLVPILVNFAISMALSAIANAMSRPKKALDNRDSQSPNNQLADRRNQMRPLQRVEDIYGTVRAIPSLMMPTYDKYLNHRRVEYGLLCVGRGYYDLADIREGDTLLADLTGASAAAYKPFTSPNSGDAPFLSIGDAIVDDVLNVSKSSSVDGIVLQAPNQQQLTDGITVRLFGPPAAPGQPFPTTKDVVYQPMVPLNNKQPNFQAFVEIGQTVTITTLVPLAVAHTSASIAATAPHTLAALEDAFFKGARVGGPVQVLSGLSNPANLGAKTITSVAADGKSVQVAETLVTESSGGGAGEFSFQVAFTGTRTVDDVGDGFIGLSGTSVFPAFPADFIVGTQITVHVDNGLTDWTNWFTLPADDRTEVWTNVVARQGMYRDDGAKSATSVNYEVQIEQLNPTTLAPTGLVETMTGSLSGATANERAETLERVTSWVGPARVRARRTSNFDYTFSGVIVDEITWTDAYAVSPVDRAHFGNKTLLHTVTQATAQTTAVQQRELNCLASRLLPTYNGTTFSGAFDANGALVSGTIHPTARVIDILAAITQDPRIGNRPLADLDVAQVWATQLALDGWHPQAGQFNYTFDNDEMSYEETVLAIGKAAFCEPYRQNGVIRLALDRPQSASVALFTHRNKEPKAETITRRFANESDYDGIELAYMDPETESVETIRLPLDGTFSKLKRIELTGIRSYEQAWFHASREHARIYNERVSIESSVTVDARSVLPNARVDIVDNTRFRAWDGDVIGQAGLVLTLSRDVEFLAGEPHSIILKRRDGTPMVIAATAGPAANQVVLAAPPAEALVTVPTPEQGVRTTFSLAADSARAAQSWLVQQISLENTGYVKLIAINYSDAYYAADAAPIPPKADVIDD